MRDRWRAATSRLRAALASGLDAATVRSLVVDINDGIIATAGIVEGFIGAGATGRAVPIAALSAMIAGGISVGGAKYAEEAAERDAEQEILAEQRRLIDSAPDQQFAELTQAYEDKGLSPGLALAVATELTAVDPVAAHLEVKHGVAVSDPGPTPLAAAFASGMGFALGAGVPLLAVLVVPDAWREVVTLVAVLVSLGVTSVVLAVAGASHVLRNLARSVLIGGLAILLSFAGGSLFHS